MNHTGQHIHGGAPQRAFERLGIPCQKVVDFSVNVSPLGPPPIVLDKWSELSNEILQYPSINGDGIADFFMERYGLQRENILPGNGSTECIYLVPRVLNFRKVAIITPSFHDYERSSRLAGAEILELPLKPSDNFAAQGFDELSNALEEVDAIMLGSPNNPTSTLFARDLLLELADRHPDKWLLIDEAFIQFVENHEEQTLANPDCLRKNILVFQSLTKFYDLPGIRLGCVIGHPETIKVLGQCKEPWTVNGIAEKLAKMLAGCQDYDVQLNRLVQRERERFQQSFNALEGIRLFDAKANFMFAQWTASDNLDDLLRVLLANGYHLRDCRNFKQLEENYFRIAIRQADDNANLISLISRIVQRNDR